MQQAFYRAYRPRSFSEVVGQDHITTILKNELIAGKTSHAYIFIGSRGTGKTTCAKLLAKAVNCINLTNGDPCGECQFCIGVEKGSLLDVTEIDAASNNGVDSIRELREEAIFTPTSAKYRVYIIDEVHMLSASAFNALLKILEEPPKHVIFILATTEVHKVLPTIISRCQRFDFYRIDSDLIAERLQYVANKESFTLSNDAALLIAQLSEGGLRDALSLLDVCTSHTAEIDVSVVSKAAGLLGSAHLIALCDSVISKDSASVLSQLREIFKKSIEPVRLCEQLIGHFRNLLVLKTVRESTSLVNCIPSEIDSLKTQSTKLSLGEIIFSLSTLSETLGRMSKATMKSVEIELALITLTDTSAREDKDSLILRIEKLEQAIRKGIIATVASTNAPTSVHKNTTISTPVLKESVTHTAPNPPPSTADTGSTTQETVLFEQWQGVLSQIEKTNKALYGMLVGTKAYYDGRRILIDVSNPVLSGMLKTNDYTKNSIKEAIALACGKQIPIGPYKIKKESEKSDPLDEFISSVEGKKNITVI